MKRITTILLLFCYLIPMMGLSVKQHYCGNKLASVSIVFTEGSSCPCGKKPMKKNCCKNKTTVLKLKDTQNFSKRLVSSFSQTFKFVVTGVPNYAFNFKEAAIERRAQYIHPPPPEISERLYLFNRVFLI